MNEDIHIYIGCAYIGCIANQPEEKMVSKLFLAAAVVLLSAASALAYDRYFDFNQAWDDAASKHQRGEALSATPRDSMRQYPKALHQMTPHDPSGRIILEGAK